MNQPLEIAANYSPPVGLEQILHPVSSDIENIESQIISDIKTDIPLLNNVTEHIIGSGGKNIKKLTEDNDVKIDIDDTGKVNIISFNEENCNSALKDIAYIVREIDVGEFYLGTVKRTLDFGAIVGLTPTLDGLIHISELAKERVGAVKDVLKEGDEVLVKCLSKERDGKIRLSRKQALHQNIEDFRD